MKKKVIVILAILIWIWICITSGIQGTVKCPHISNWELVKHIPKSFVLKFEVCW